MLGEPLIDAIASGGAQLDLTIHFPECRISNGMAW